MQAIAANLSTSGFDRLVGLDAFNAPAPFCEFVADAAAASSDYHDFLVAVASMGFHELLESDPCFMYGHTVEIQSSAWILITINRSRRRRDTGLVELSDVFVPRFNVFLA